MNNRSADLLEDGVPLIVPYDVDEPSAVEVEMKETAKAIDREVIELGFRALGPDQMIEPITTYWGRANCFSGQAEKLRILGRLNRWATGRLLLMVKAMLKHGEFEAWLEEHRDELGFVKSSAENYMRLVRDYPTAQRFLDNEAPLREMYARNAAPENNAAPATQEREEPLGRAKSHPSKTEALMKSLTTLQKRMRHLLESDEQLEDEQLRQMRLVKDEIDRFFETFIANHS